MAARYVFPDSRAIFQDGPRHFLFVFCLIRYRSILAVFFMFKKKRKKKGGGPQKGSGRGR